MKALGLAVSEEKIFENCIFWTSWPQGGANFDPRGKILTTFIEDLHKMLYTKYEGYGPCALGEEKLFRFSHYKSM